MEHLHAGTPATLESVWASFQETDRLLKESNARFEKELKESRAEFEKDQKAASARFEKEMKEASARFEKEMKESREAYDHRIKKLEELTGAWSNNHGSFAEEYFFNSFEKGKQNFFGEQFDDITKHLTHFWQGLKDEYDIVLYNHTSVALIEVKYKAHINDIPKVLKKAKTFRILFPNYQGCKIYLGLASMCFYPELEQECINHGIAIIKQVGDTVMINSEGLKVY